nr:TPA_asm: polyprotein [Halyomorpha halys virus]
MDIAIKVLVNANKFMCGKLLVSSKYDSYQADDVQSGYQSALQRNHVILDLNANNEAQLDIPFRYHRPYVRLLNKNMSKGVRPSKYCSLYFHVLSQLQTGKDGPSDCNFRVMFKLRNIEFAGMSYRVSVQMDTGNKETNDPTDNFNPVLDNRFLQTLDLHTNFKDLLRRPCLIIDTATLNYTNTGAFFIPLQPPNRDWLPMNNGVANNIWSPTLQASTHMAITNLFRLWRGGMRYTIVVKETDYPIYVSLIPHSGVRYMGNAEIFKNTAWPLYGMNFITEIINPKVNSTVTIEAPYETENTWSLIWEEQPRRNYTWRDKGDTNAGHLAITSHAPTGPQITVWWHAADDFELANFYGTPNTLFNGWKYRYADTDGPTTQGLGIEDLVTPPTQRALREVLKGAENAIDQLGANSNRDKPPDLQLLSVVPHPRKNFASGKGPIDVMPLRLNPYTATNYQDIVVPQDEPKSFYDLGRIWSLYKSFQWSKTNTIDTIIGDMIIDPCCRNYSGDYSGEPTGLEYALGNYCFWSGVIELRFDFVSNSFHTGTVQISAEFGRTTSATDLCQSSSTYTKIFHLGEQKTCNFNVPYIYDTVMRRTTANLINPYNKAETNKTIKQRALTVAPLSQTHVKVRVINELRPVASTPQSIEVLVFMRAGKNFAMRGLKGFSYIPIHLNPGVDDFPGNSYAPPDPSTSGTRSKREVEDPFKFDIPEAERNEWNEYKSECVKSPQDKSMPRVQCMDAFDIWHDYWDRLTRPMKWDFRHKVSPSKEVTDSAKEVLITASLASIPYVGTPLAIARTTTRIMNNVDKVSTQMQATMLEVNKTMEEVSTQMQETMTTANETMETVTSAIEHLSYGTAEKITEVTDSILDTNNKLQALISGSQDHMTTIMQTIRDIVDRIVGTSTTLISWGPLLFDTFLDIVNACIHRTWSSVGIIIVRFISKVFTVTTSVLSQITTLGNNIGTHLSQLLQPSMPHTQAEVQIIPNIAGILLAIAGLVTGAHLRQQRYLSIPQTILETICNSRGISYILGVIRLVGIVFNTFKDYVLECFGYVNPEVRALRMLADRSTIVEDFVREAQIITSESNTGLLSRPDYRVRMWKTVLQAHQIQRLIITAPSSVAIGPLYRLTNEVIKFGNEKFLDLAASPVRYEPFVFINGGEAGIGKSFMTEKIAQTLLQRIGWTAPSSSHIFYRCSGERFWSGYRDQPVVVYDEWFNTNDSQRCADQIVEFMKLKSTSLFIPEMAHLEEKKIHGNPLIIIINTNNIQPNLSDYAREPNAVMRRMDEVFQVKLKPDISREELTNPDNASRFADFHHLTFMKYDKRWVGGNVSYVSNQTEANYDNYITYLSNQFARYHAKELKLVQRRMEALPGFAESIANGNIQSDPFTLFYGLNHQLMTTPSLSQNSWTPYEQLEQAVNIIAQHMEQREENPALVLPSFMSWDQAVAAAHSQNDYLAPGEHEVNRTFVVAGILMDGSLLNYIATATKPTISRWLQEIRDTGISYQCTVCMDYVRCVYECENSTSETRHVVCADCYTGLLGISSTSQPSCPVCRSGHLRPILAEFDVYSMSIWKRALYYGLLTVETLLDTMIEYYNMRRTHWITHGFITWAISFAMQCCDMPIESVLFFSSYVVSMRTAIAINVLSSVMTQSDNGLELLESDSDDEGGSQTSVWDTPERPDTETAELVPEPDAFTARLPDNFKEYLITHFKPQLVCNHLYLTDQNVNTVLLQGDTISVFDTLTHSRIDFDYHCCDARCATLHADRIVTIYREFARRNYLHLRNTIIQYHNRRLEQALNEIPTPLRPAWIDTSIAKCMDRDWWYYLSTSLDYIRTPLLVLTGMTAVIGGVIYAYQAIVSLSSQISPESGPIGSEEIQARQSRVAARHVIQPRSYFAQNAREELIDASAPPDAFKSIQKKVALNTTAISIVTPNGKHQLLYGTGLFGFVLLIPRHYYKHIVEHIAKGSTLTAYRVQQPQKKVELKLTLNDIYASDVTDIAYMRMPPSFNAYKDLRNYLCTADDINGNLPSEALFLSNPGRSHTTMHSINIDLYGVSKKQTVMDESTYFVIEDALHYNYSEPGACGSFILIENTQRPIVAMHVAGTGTRTSGEGWGVLLLKESLDSLPATLPNSQGIAEMVDLDLLPLSEMKFIYEDDTNILYLGALPPEKVPYIPTKSKLVPSLVYKEPGLEVDIEPAILSRDDKRYLHKETPLWAGVKKHGVTVKEIPNDMVDSVGEWYWDGWLSKMKPSVLNPAPLNLDQNVCGLDIDHYNGIDLQTSVGFPYIVNNKDKKKKSDYIEVIRDDQLKPIAVKCIDPAVITEMELFEMHAMSNRVYPSIFIDTLKDEKRPKDKLLKLGGTRVFCNGPLHNVLLVRKYFLHFIAAFMKNRHQLLHAVGVNALSDEWTRIANALLTKNTQTSTLDYHNFGAGFSALVAQKAYDLILRWTKQHVKNHDGTDLDMRILVALTHDCLNSTHVVNNTVYMQGCGSPSGSVFTTTINTMVNILYLFLSVKYYYKPNPTNYMHPVSFIKNNMAIYAYGDDLIFSVSPQYIDQFNSVTISEFLAQYSIVATDAGKMSTIIPHLPLTKSTFLKRRFNPHPTRHGLFLSPLEEYSIKSCTQWVWKSVNKANATRVNAAAALLNAHGWGPKYYAKFKHLLNNALVKKKVEPLALQWQEIDEQFFDTGLDSMYDDIINDN